MCRVNCYCCSVIISWQLEKIKLEVHCNFCELGFILFVNLIQEWKIWSHLTVPHCCFFMQAISLKLCGKKALNLVWVWPRMAKWSWWLGSIGLLATWTPRNTLRETSAQVTYSHSFAFLIVLMGGEAHYPIRLHQQVCSSRGKVEASVYIVWTELWTKDNGAFEWCYGYVMV